MSKLEELKAAYAAATPGDNWERRGLSVYGDDSGPGTAPYIAEVQRKEDADYFALAHNAMPELLEAVELLKMAAHALEAPGDFTPEEMQEQVIGDIRVFLAHLEGA